MKKLVIVLLVLALGAVPAISHSWYPASCCSGYDCDVAAVTFVAAEPDKPMKMAVTVRGRTALVPDNMERRRSPDSRVHACVVDYGDGALPSVRCVWLPDSF